MIELLEHTVSDTYLTFPILFITYLFLEHLNKKSCNIEIRIFHLLQKLGPLIGSFLGLFPQCGFSVLAAILFLQKNITLGTLISVFIATSDEAIPILLSNAELIHIIHVLLFNKFGIAIMTGYIIDKIYKQSIVSFAENITEGNIPESTCSCCNQNILPSELHCSKV